MFFQALQIPICCEIVYMLRLKYAWQLDSVDDEWGYFAIVCLLLNGTGMDQRCANFNFMKFKLFQEQVFTVENGCCCPRMVVVC